MKVLLPLHEALIEYGLHYFLQLHTGLRYSCAVVQALASHSDGVSIVVKAVCVAGVESELRVDDKLTVAKQDLFVVRSMPTRPPEYVQLFGGSYVVQFTDLDAIDESATISGFEVTRSGLVYVKTGIIEHGPTTRLWSGSASLQVPLSSFVYALDVLQERVCCINTAALQNTQTYDHVGVR